MKPYAVFAVLALCLVMAVPALAEETGKTKKVVKKIVCSADEDDAEIMTVDEGCCVIKVKEDGKKKVIRIDSDGLLETGDDLDTETRLKLLDEKIRFIKATGDLKTDLAVQRVELAKLKLADEPDQGKVKAREKQVQELKAKLKVKQHEHQEAVEKIAPDEGVDLLMFDCLYGDELLGTNCLMLTSEDAGLIKKCIKVEVEEDEAD